MLIFIAKSQIQFEPKNTNTGLIFTDLLKAHISYDNFKLTYYVDLNNFISLTARIKYLNEKTKNLCEKLGLKSSCHVIIKQLKNQLGTILYDLRLMQSQQNRKRRTVCEFCGKIAHWFSGVMDTETALEYDKTINALNNETLTQHELLRKQSLLIETTIQTSRSTTIDIAQNLNDLDARQNALKEQIEEKLNETDAKIAIQELVSITALLIDEHNRVLFKINSCLTEAKRGKVPSLIPTSRLEIDLKQIASVLKSNQKLPINILQENSLHIFKFAEVKTTLFAEKLLMEITIPIAERDDFRLYKATPIPIKISSTTIIVKIPSNYFLLNTDGHKFIPMEQNQIDEGMMIAPEEVLYKPSTITQHRSDKICAWKLFNEPSLENAIDICEIGIIPPMNYLISINENNLYFIHIESSLKIWENCNDVSQKSLNLSQNGILKIYGKCSMRTEDFSIQSRNTYSLNISQVIVPNSTMQTITNDQINKLTQFKEFKFDIPSETSI